MRNRFCDLRRERGYNQKELADKLDLRQSTVAMWERGKSMPSTRTLTKIMALFALPADEILRSFLEPAAKLPNAFKQLMIEKEVAQPQLASQLGIDQTAVSQWCTGKTRPALNRIGRIAEILGVDPLEVLNCFTKRSLSGVLD